MLFFVLSVLCIICRTICRMHILSWATVRALYVLLLLLFIIESYRKYTQKKKRKKKKKKKNH